MACRSRKDSKRSNNLAEGSTKFAREANRLSMEANAISREAKGFAEEATELTKRAESRELESHDVSWTYRWVDDADGVLCVINTGDDEALQAVVRLTVDGALAEAKRQDVDGKEYIEVVHEGLQRAIRKDRAEHELAVKDHRRAAAAYQGMGYLGTEPFDLGTFADVKIEVSWKTPLGRSEMRTIHEGRDVF